MKKTICDKCKRDLTADKEYVEITRTRITLFSSGRTTVRVDPDARESIELCPSCEAAFQNWLTNGH